MFSQYIQEKTLDFLIKGISFTPPSTFWLALYLGPPGTEGLANIMGTPRQQVTFGDRSGLQIASTNTLSFLNTPGGELSHGGLWSAGTGGDFLYAGILSQVRYLSMGEGLVFQPGAVVLRHSELVISYSESDE